MDWEYELKKYLVKKFKERMGFDVGIENIHMVEINIDMDLSQLTIEHLGYIYAFSLMKEDFEHAKVIREEIDKKKHKVDIDVDENKKTGAIQISKKTKKKSPPIHSIPIKIYPDGIMIDWESEDL